MKTILKISLIGWSFLMVPFSLYAQDKIYYDLSWQECEQRDAVYYGFITREKGVWVRQDYYRFNDQIHCEGYYQSRSKKQRTGLWTWWHENGQLVRKSHYDKNLLHGQEEHWYVNGQLKEKGAYIEDKRMGIWESWYETGQKKSEIDYNPAYRPVNHWLENGEQTVVEGNGKMMEFHPNGAIKYQGQIKKGNRTGLWEVFYADGKRQEIVFFDQKGLATSMQQFWYPNGQLECQGMRQDGYKHGVWDYFDETGEVICRIRFDAQAKTHNNPVYEFGNRRPVVLNIEKVYAAIGYPEQARLNGLEGMVVAQILVNEKGRYVSHEFIGTAPAILVRAVSEHLEELRFTPFIKDMKRVRFRMELPFVFDLKTNNVFF